ncbi:hypothetical protein BDR06DRAFT_400252 [Suillus hirtellus]|nr:hypothetical protein BDR06DRAFT_400252 [Suillus hirtellus]
MHKDRSIIDHRSVLSCWQNLGTGLEKSNVVPGTLVHGRTHANGGRTPLAEYPRVTEMQDLISGSSLQVACLPLYVSNRSLSDHLTLLINCGTELYIVHHPAIIEPSIINTTTDPRPNVSSLQTTQQVCPYTVPLVDTCTLWKTIEFMLVSSSKSARTSA